MGYVAATLPFYTLLAWGASILGSYRHEPSGVQYALLPVVIGPLLMIMGGVLGWGGRRLAARWLRTPLPFIAGLVALALPSISLADAMLETGRWVLIGVGALHAALSVWAISVVRSLPRPA